MKFFRKLFGRAREDDKYSVYAPKKPVGDDDVEALAELMTRKGRDGLDLEQAELSADGLARLLESLPALKALKLGETQLDDDALAPLRALRELEFLDLHGVPANGRCFVELEPLPELWYLNLRGTRLLDMSVLALCRFPKLHTLDVSATRVTPLGLPYCSRLESLRVLRVAELGLDEDSLPAALAKQEELKVEL